MNLARIGIISDTHGLMRPEALNELRGMDWIHHAGDVGSPAVLGALRTLAPVYAVRGNNDRSDWANALPETMTLSYAGTRLHLLHDVHALSLDPGVSGIAVVISGHSHKPAVESRDGTLFVNPGSAGPRRFSLPVTIAVLHLGNEPEATVVRLIE